MNLGYLNNEIRFCNVAHQELAQQKANRRRLSFALRMRDLERQRFESNKFCPHCFIELPLNGICDTCGYEEE